MGQIKKLGLQKKIKTLEKNIKELKRKQVYTSEILLEEWMTDILSILHPDIAKLLNLAALILPSTAEVERSFSLMKLVCTHLRNTDSLKDHRMKLCKFRSLKSANYRQILQKWIQADGSKGKTRKVSTSP